MARTHVSGFSLAVSLLAALVLHGCCHCAFPKARPHTRVETIFQKPPDNPANATDQSGSSYSTAVASGSFDGEVYVAPMSVATGTGSGQIPGPTGDDTYLILRDPTDTSTANGTWSRVDIPGSYDGSTQYKMLVRVTYFQAALGVDSHWGRLDDITGPWEPIGL
jgi:hypothetical protein